MSRVGGNSYRGRGRSSGRGRGGGSSRGRGGGGGGGGRGGGGGSSSSYRGGSDLYSDRHKRIFDDNGDGDDDFSFNDAADDFALDDLVGDERLRGNGGGSSSGASNSESLRRQEEMEEKAQQIQQKKLDRKQSRKQSKTEAKQTRISQQREWSEQCRKRREEKEKEKLKLERHREREQLLKKKQQQQQQQQKKKASEKASVAAAAAGKKSVSFVDAAIASSTATQQQKQKQNEKDKPVAAASAAPAPVSAYVPPALRARMMEDQQQQQQQQQDGDEAAKSNKKLEDAKKQTQLQEDNAAAAAASAAADAAAAISLAKYVVPARRTVSASLTAIVHRCLNKLVLENTAVIANELVGLYSTSSEPRSDITSAIGASIVNSSVGTAHLTTRQAVAIAAVVRALQIKCGADIGAALVSRVATELRAAMLLGPDDDKVQTNKYLEEIERKASHGAMMVGALTHVACCSAHLPLSFLHDCSMLLQQISEQQTQHSSLSFINEATCVASCCLQLLRVVGTKLFELVPMHLNGWINRVEEQLRQQQDKQHSVKNNTVRFAAIRLEVVLHLAKQIVSGGNTASASATGAAAASGGSRRQREAEQQQQQQQQQSKGNAAAPPDEETMAKCIDALADVVRPGAAAQDRRAWKRAFATLSVPTLEWAVASQPEKQTARWWESNHSNNNGGSSGGLLWEQENEAKLAGAAAASAANAASSVLSTGVERRELNSSNSSKKKSQNDDDSDQQQQHLLPLLDEDDFDEENEQDDDEQEEYKRELKLRNIKRTRAFESAASGQRFVSERQRKVLLVLHSAFDDGEACQRLMHHIEQNESSDVATVIVQCCMQEQTYNSFYAKVTSRLLSPAMPKKMLTRTKKAFQFALWDTFGGLRVEAASGAVPDVASLVNLAGFVVHLFHEDRYNLSLLRGLDIDVSIPASVGLFLRIFLLRAIIVLDFPQQLVALLFGHHTSKKKNGEDSGEELEEDGLGNVRSVLGANSVVKQKLRSALLAFFDAQFMDEKAAAKWMVPLFDVVAGNSLEEEELAMVLEELPRRMKIARKAIKDGGE